MAVTELKTEKARNGTLRVFIGKTSADCTKIAEGIKRFCYGNRHAVTGQFVANAKVSGDHFQPHKDWWWELVLDGDCRYAFYTQEVSGSNVAVVDDGDNVEIAYMVATQSIVLGDKDKTEKVRTHTFTEAMVSEQEYDLGEDETTIRGRAKKISHSDA